MRPHILLLTTGGTIASLPTAEGLAPGLDGEALAGLLPQGIMDCYDITIRDILHLDSSNIQPEEWQTIARHVFENRMEYSGIVITHGTDTMAYTASVLSFMLRGISIPVVLTGAQLPMAHPLSDGMENLRTALAMAASGVPGVFLAFDRKVILGCRAVKTRTTDFDAFESVNWPLAANVDGKGRPSPPPPERAPCGTSCATRCSSSSSPPDSTRRSSTCCSRCTTGAWSSRPLGRAGSTSSAAISLKNSTPPPGRGWRWWCAASACMRAVTSPYTRPGRRRWPMASSRVMT